MSLFCSLPRREVSDLPSGQLLKAPALLTSQLRAKTRIIRYISLVSSSFSSIHSFKPTSGLRSTSPSRSAGTR